MKPVFYGILPWLMRTCTRRPCCACGSNPRRHLIIATDGRKMSVRPCSTPDSKTFRKINGNADSASASRACILTRSNMAIWQPKYLRKKRYLLLARAEMSVTINGDNPRQENTT
jgi:hypothetical protein